jgi:hypothetical protein
VRIKRLLYRLLGIKSPSGFGSPSARASRAGQRLAEVVWDQLPGRKRVLYGADLWHDSHGNPTWIDVQPGLDCAGPGCERSCCGPLVVHSYVPQEGGSAAACCPATPSPVPGEDDGENGREAPVCGGDPFDSRPCAEGGC